MTKERERKFRKCLHGRQKKSPPLAYHIHTVGTQEVFPVKHYSTRARFGVLELITVCFLSLVEKKETAG